MTLKAAEQAFFSDSENPLFAWDSNTIAEIFEKNGWKVIHAESVLEEKRRISETEISRWFSKESSSYGKALLEAIGEDSLELLKTSLVQECSKKLFNWKMQVSFLTIIRN